MGRKAKKLNLDPTAEKDLKEGFKQLSNPQFSRRCHIVLLKGQGRTSQEVADIFGVTTQPVNSWVRRYVAEGMEGLKTRQGQGRKRIFDKGADAEKVKRIVKKERQRLKLAKEEIATELKKEFSMSTLSRFLKTLAAPIDGSG